LLRERDFELDFFPPRLEAPGELAIRAARCFDIPFLRRPSYCFSFFTLGRLLGMTGSFPHGAPACASAPNELFPGAQNDETPNALGLLSAAHG
jgi:hypothetical protein